MQNKLHAKPYIDVRMDINRMDLSEKKHIYIPPIECETGVRCMVQEWAHHQPENNNQTIAQDR